MEAVLTEKSVKLIAVMLSEPKIKAAVYEKLDHTEKYKIYTINVMVALLWVQLDSIFGTR